MTDTVLGSPQPAFAWLRPLQRLHRHMMRTSEVMVKLYYSRPWDTESVSPRRA